ncbi:MAG TPA: FtsH protease activity modulator HflK [Steroidobacteraceae bacterium]
MAIWRRRGTGGEPPGGNALMGLWGVLLVVGVWLLSGLYQLEPGEHGVLQRFGRFVTDIGPGGVGVHWPWPIETLTRINTERIASVDFQSRALTADLALLDVRGAVQFQFNDARRALYGYRDPELQLRALTESAVRQTLAGMTLDQALSGPQRQDLAATAQRLIDGALGAAGSGIKLVALNLTDIQVPEPVQAAWSGASKAIEDRQRVVLEAQTYANDLPAKARHTVETQLQEAEVYKAQLIASSEEEAARFTQLASAYAQAPEATRNTLYVQTMKSILSGPNKVIIDGKSGANNMIYLPIDKLVNPTGAAAASAAPAGAANAAAVAAPAAPSPAAAEADPRSRDRDVR